MEFVTKCSLLLPVALCARSYQDIRTDTGYIVVLESHTTYSGSNYFQGRLVCTANRYHDGETIRINTPKRPESVFEPLGGALCEEGIKMFEELVDRRCLSTEGRRRLDELVLTNTVGRPAMFHESDFDSHAFPRMHIDHSGYLIINTKLNIFQAVLFPARPSSYFKKLPLINGTTNYVAIRDDYLTRRGRVAFAPLSAVMTAVEMHANPTEYLRSLPEAKQVELPK